VKGRYRRCVGWMGSAICVLATAIWVASECVHIRPRRLIGDHDVQVSVSRGVARVTVCPIARVDALHVDVRFWMRWTVWREAPLWTPYMEWKQGGEWFRASIPLWMVTIGGGVLGAWGLWPRRPRHAGRCRCGYDLRELQAKVCPECGNAISKEVAREPAR
jgi:hypothetical protein